MGACWLSAQYRTSRLVCRTFARSSGEVAHWKPLPPCSLARAPTSSACSDTEA